MKLKMSLEDNLLKIITIFVLKAIHEPFIMSIHRVRRSDNARYLLKNLPIHMRHLFAPRTKKTL